MSTLSRISDRSLGVRVLGILLLLNSALILFAFYSVMDSKQGYEERARLTTQNLTRKVDKVSQQVSGRLI